MRDRVDRLCRLRSAAAVLAACARSTGRGSLPIILLADEDEEDRIIRALELGINDYLTRPVDPQELIARLRTQVRRKRYNDQLRASVTQSIEMAVTDGLTGLHNRRYLDSHLQRLVERAVARRRPLSVLITDLDRFKRINDTHGHDGGDDGAARIRPPPEQERARHRPGLPLWRRGIRRS